MKVRYLFFCVSEDIFDSADNFNVWCFASLGTQACGEQRGQLPQRQRTSGRSQLLDRQARGPERASPSHPAAQPSLQPGSIPGEYTRVRFPTSSQQRVQAPCTQSHRGAREEEEAQRHCPAAVCVASQAHQTEDQKCCCKMFFPFSFLLLNTFFLHVPFIFSCLSLQVSILDTGEVCMELLKCHGSQERVKEVLQISCDGSMVSPLWHRF